MYSLNVFKDNNIDYSWDTIFVGRKLEFLLPQEVSVYAMEYFIDNSKCDDIYIAELAYGVPDSEIDDILDKVLINLKHEKIKIDQSMWNLEKRKWRYCILRYLVSKYLNHPEMFLREYDIVWAEFGHLVDMEKYLSFYVTDSGCQEHYKNEEEYYQCRMNRIIDVFIKNEKYKIEKYDTCWS